MEASHLEVAVRRVRGGTVLDLRGEIDGFAERALTAAYAEAERADPTAILLEVEQVRYINSTGIALIVGLVAKARAARRRLLAYGLSSHYVDIFEITRLADFVRLVDDEQSAIAEADR